MMKSLTHSLSSMSRSTAVFLLALFGMLGSLAAQEADGLALLRGMLKETRAKLEKPLVEFQATYTGQLEELKTKAQVAGDLEQIIAIDKEIEMAPSGGSEIPAQYRELAKLRGIYDSHRKKLMQNRDGQFRRALADYRASVRKHQIALTKEGKIEEAKQAKFEVEAIDAQLKAGASAFTAGGSGLLRSTGAAGKLVGFGEFDGKPFELSAAQQRARYTRVDICYGTWTALEESGKVASNATDSRKVPASSKDIVEVHCDSRIIALIGSDGMPTFLGSGSDTKHCPKIEPGTLAKLGLGRDLNAALLKDGTLKVFGHAFEELNDFPRADLTKNVADVIAGHDMLAIRLKDGMIHLVDAKGKARSKPFDGKDVVAMECGNSLGGGGLVILSKDGTVTSKWLPKTPADLKKAVQVRATRELIGAQLEDGTWTVWGRNERAATEMNARLKELGPLKDLALGPKGFVAIQ